MHSLGNKIRISLAIVSQVFTQDLAQCLKLKMPAQRYNAAPVVAHKFLQPLFKRVELRALQYIVGRILAFRHERN